MLTQRKSKEQAEGGDFGEGTAANGRELWVESWGRGETEEHVVS